MFSPTIACGPRVRNETCKLVVEVKHYKSAKQRDFNDVLIDYARAHPTAEVLLVNYGRLGDVPDLGDASISSRCRQIGNLTSDNHRRRTIFRNVVANAVGARKWPCSSSSMSPRGWRRT